MSDDWWKTGPDLPDDMILCRMPTPEPVATVLEWAEERQDTTEDDRWTPMERIAAAGRSFDELTKDWPEKYGAEERVFPMLEPMNGGAVTRSVAWEARGEGCTMWIVDLCLLRYGSSDLGAHVCFYYEPPAELVAEVREWAVKHGVGVADG